MTFLWALLGFLMARLLWDTIKHFARKQGELPIVWFFKTLTLVSMFIGLIVGLGMLTLWALTRIQ